MKESVFLISSKETFKKMDTENSRHENNSKNLGVLIENETEEIVKRNKSTKDVEVRN